TNTNHPQDINGTYRASSLSIAQVTQSTATGVVTFTPSVASNIQSGDVITVTGISADYDGTYTVLTTGGGPNLYTFTASKPGIKIGLPALPSSTSMAGTGGTATVVAFPINVNGPTST